LEHEVVLIMHCRETLELQRHFGRSEELAASLVGPEMTGLGKHGEYSKCADLHRLHPKPVCHAADRDGRILVDGNPKFSKGLF